MVRVSSLCALTLSVVIHGVGGLALARYGSLPAADGEGVSSLLLLSPSPQPEGLPPVKPEESLRSESVPPDGQLPDPPTMLPESIPAEVQVVERPPEPERLEVVAGVDESTAITRAWKGVNESEATPHSAPKFSNDQAGFTPRAGATGDGTPSTSQTVSATDEPREPGADAGSGLTDGTSDTRQPRTKALPAESLPPRVPRPTPAPMERKPDEEMRARSREASLPAPDERAQNVEQVRSSASMFLVEAPWPEGILPAYSAMQLHLTPPRAPREAAILDESSRPTRAGDAARAEQSEEQRSGVPAAGSLTGTPGVRADDESVARSATDPIVVRPGKPVARKGLNIKTSYARFSPSTIVLSRPRNPLVRLTFGRDGKMRRAEFVDGETTGSLDADKTLLDSLHRWSASGKDLERLPVNDPDAGVTLTFRIVF